ncbi:MAG: methylmalonyl-CoA mutase family protein [Anderseniella sp.]|uniref:methylmalonyl-CoA mutase family protein n=1 Tax=Parasphingorhabdus sp. TaxID=2709688 RepID=UPI003279DC84
MSELKLADEFPALERDDWRALVDASLKAKSYETLRTRTADGIVIEPVYGAAENATPLPAAPARAAADAWTLVQRSDIPEIAAANTQMLDDLMNGASGISLVLPGSISAGASGVAVTDVRSVQRLFEGVELDLIDLRLDGGRHGRDLALVVLDEYKRRRLDLSRCSLTLGLDPLGAYAHGGKVTERSELSRRFGEMFTLATGMDHQGPVAQADARVYHGAGCSEAQELGFALATAVDYLRMLEAGGITPADVAPRMSMMLTTDADQFVTIAKLRAARLLWARLLDVSGLAPTPVTLHVETAARMMSKRDPHVNLLRATTASFAAGIGGADSVSVLPFTHALGLPDGFARRMARNVQSLLLEESRVGRVRDATAGSGHVEDLTHELARSAWSVFQIIEAHGGMMAALTDGKVQAMIADVRIARDKNIARRKMSLTGVSEFPNLNEAPNKTLDMYVPADWKIGDAAPAAGMETCKALQQHRLSEGFEALRDTSDAVLSDTGTRPTVFLAVLGKPADFTVRATWMSNLLASGGVDVVTGPPDELAASKLNISCICSSDAVYSGEAEEAARSLAQQGATYIMMAGKPGEMEASLTAAGVQRFVHAGQDMLELLNELSILATGEAS